MPFGFVLITVHMGPVFSEGKTLSQFHADGGDTDKAGLRTIRAHANALKNLALPAALVTLAVPFLGHRVLQFLARRMGALVV